MSCNQIGRQVLQYIFLKKGTVILRLLVKFIIPFLPTKTSQKKCCSSERDTPEIIMEAPIIEQSAAASK